MKKGKAADRSVEREILLDFFESDFPREKEQSLFSSHGENRQI